MTDTNIADALVFPEDEGTGIPKNKEDRTSAGHHALLAQHLQGSYVGQGVGFANVDTAGDSVDITQGHAFIEISNVTVQSGGGPSYDTTLPNPVVLAVVLPSDVTDLSLDTDAVNDVYLAVDAAANDGAYLRHGSSVSAPSDPSVKLGTVDTASGDTTRPNDDADVSAASGDFETLTTDDAQFPVEPPADISGSRSLDTWYQNTTGHPLRVTVGVVNSGAGNRAVIQMSVNSNQTQNRVDESFVTAHDASDVVARVSVLVPDQYYYNVDFSVGTLRKWSEQTVGQS